MVRRAHREYRVPIRVTDLDRRNGFEETVLGYTLEEARREACRCLDCDRMCSLCVGVCPNIALMTYGTAPVRADLPVLAVARGRVIAVGSAPFVVDQRLQVAVLTDFCNECGTCVTACPTSGRPYVDKPRLYLERTDFEAQPSNAFMFLGDAAVEGRFDGATHRLDRRPGEATLAYWSPRIRAILDAATFEVIEAEPVGPPGPAADAISLEPALIMATLLASFTASLPYLPTGLGAGDGTRVAAPALSLPG